MPAAEATIVVRELTPAECELIRDAERHANDERNAARARRREEASARISYMVDRVFTWRFAVRVRIAAWCMRQLDRAAAREWHRHNQAMRTLAVQRRRVQGLVR